VLHNGGVHQPQPVEVPVRSPERLGRLIGPERFEEMREAARSAMDALDGNTIWNISSTSHGGGVAEMLSLLLGYAKGVGVDARWMVIEADAEFFAITKRLHNRIHGVAGDDGALGPREAAHYGDVLAENAAAMDGRRIRAGDVVYLHDPQTVGLAGALRADGARIVWRCHIGSDRANAHTQEAWAFLQPYLAACETFVFSHAAFVPPQLAESDVWIVAPSIDPFSPKNRPLPAARGRALLARVGLLAGERDPAIDAVVGGAPPFDPDEPMVLQVSRWDRLKDMRGVLEGFAEYVTSRSDARLALVGPEVAAVSDDPEGAEVLAECTEAWRSLPARARDAIRLVTLPMEDPEANALMVNAAQRHAAVIVQKSLQEGFGLTVTEAMWKARPVVASAVGGIVDQLPDDAGVLLHDPADLAAFGDAVATLLGDPARMRSLGRRARRHVRDNFLSDRHLREYAQLIRHMTQPRGEQATPG
jgi:trehalose synthase